MRRFSLRFAFSLLMIVLVLLAWSTLDWVLDRHARYMPDPDEIVHHDGRAMTARHHLLTVRFPNEEVGPVTFFLLARTTKSLWAGLYVLAGIAGWCGSVWLQMLQKKTGEAFLPSLFLAALAGLVTFLIVTIVATFVPVLSGVRGELSVVAIAAGLFVGTFYQELEVLLKALFEWIRKKIGGGPPPPQKDSHDDDDEDGKKVAALLLFTLTAFTSDASMLYQCVDPKTPVCTASSEEGKEKCPHKCNRWIETSLTTAWLASVQADDPQSIYANWFLASATERLFGTELFEGAPPKIGTVWKNPDDYGLEVIGKEDVAAGTLVLLPNLTAVVTSTAADPLDSMVVYPSATMNGKPNEEKLRDLVGTAAPKFVLPEGVLNEATAAVPPRE